MAARAIDALDYTSFASTIDLYAVKDRDVERLVIVTATSGASIVCRTKGSGDNDRTYSVSQGDALPIQIRQIRSVTNITRVRVEWGEF